VKLNKYAVFIILAIFPLLLFAQSTTQSDGFINGYGELHVTGVNGTPGPFLPLSGGTLTGALTGTSVSLSGNLTFSNTSTVGASWPNGASITSNTGGTLNISAPTTGSYSIQLIENTSGAYLLISPGSLTMSDNAGGDLVVGSGTVVANASQHATGIAEFAVDDNNGYYALLVQAGYIVTTFNNILDDGSGNLSANGNITTIGKLVSSVATGTAPLAVTSTTVVPNLNVSQLLGGTWAIPGAIGSTTASSGAFTTLSASSTVSGTGFSNYLASPPAIGGTAANTGTFTTLNASNLAVSSASTTLATFINTSTNGAGIIGGSLGNVAAPSGSRLGYLIFQGSTNTSNTPYNAAAVVGYATETWSASAGGSQIQFQVTPNTTQTRATALTLNQDSTANFASHLIAGQTGSITTTSCGTSTITSGSNDTRGTITAGTATTCQVNFIKAYASAPFCVISSANATGAGLYVSATAVGSFTVAGTTVTGAAFNYHCIQ